MEFVRGTTLVHLKIRCWSGEVKASRDSDIHLGTDGKLPPESLLDLGRKKIFPPKALDPMTSQRKAADRACLAFGTRFMGGYAVPDDDVEELVTKLEGIESKFNSNLQDFLRDFDAKKEDWIAENQEYEHIIRDHVPNVGAVKNSYAFSFKLYKLQPVEGFEPDEAEVADQILHEIGMSCKEMSDRLLDRKRAISGEKLSEQLDPIVNKLDALSFGNGRILKVLSEFQTLKNSIPMERIDQEHATFSHTVTFLSMCADSDKLERIIQGSFSVNQLIDRIRKPEAAPTSSTSVGDVPPKLTSPVAPTMSAYF